MLLPLAMGSQLAQAQSAPVPAKKPAAVALPKAPAPATKPEAPKPPPAPDKGWSQGPVPAWVADAEASEPAIVRAPGKSRRDELVDLQANFALAKPQFFARLRAVSWEASTLPSVSEWQVYFNPDYQRVTVHSAKLWRDGVAQDRLSDARLELMRREQQLEQSIINGMQTLLLVLHDVRVGDRVEVAYSIEGVNPIFEGRIDDSWSLAGTYPIDEFHWRLLAPANRVLRTKSLLGEFTPESTVTGNVQEMRLKRKNVEAVSQEGGIPPWVKVAPALLVSEYASWADVEAWAGRLFAAASEPDEGVRAQVETFRAKGLSGEALVSEVLRFVQDEVRYFSVSLGVNSHRPKLAGATLRERLGDCKDKVALLNALLQGLGIEARPALVSTYRHRGLSQFLPGLSQIDHVISQVKLGDKFVYLDPTLTSQGFASDSRGQLSYGAAVVVGAGGELQAVAEPPDRLNVMEFEQRWDLSHPGDEVSLTFVMRAKGALAENYRRALSGGHLTQVADQAASSFARLYPGLKVRAEPVIKDSRESNVFEMQQEFLVVEAGRYNSGGINYEFGAVELYDALGGPQESRRRYPFVLSMPKRVESTITTKSTYPIPPRTLSPVEISDKHFRMTVRTQIDGAQVSFNRAYERRAEEVLVPDLESYRQSVLRARGQLFNRMRTPLFDPETLRSESIRLFNAAKGRVGDREDSLLELMAREEMTRHLDNQALKVLPAKSAMAIAALLSRAQASNHLGEFKDALADADAALIIKPSSDDAREARAVALVGLNRFDDAMAEFEKVEGSEGRSNARYWMGAILVHLGRYAAAEKHLLDALAASGDEQRDFVLLWLYLAAEGAGKRGGASIAPYLQAADGKKLAGAMLLYFGGRMDRDAVFKVAEEKPGMRRLNLAELNFYLGQQQIVQGEPGRATRYMKEVVDTKAVPYREFTFAKHRLSN